ncbi:MAG: TRAP transporter small permease [Candidatus Competibacterales bacterium]
MLRLVDKIAEAIAVSCFMVSSAFIFINVLNRYLVLGLLRDWAKDYHDFRPTYFAIRDVLGNIVVTADEVPGLLLVWVAFLGAYMAMRKEGHIAFSLIVDYLPSRARQLVRGFNAFLISGFLVMLLWQSIRVIRVSGATEIETAEIAQGWFMLILPIAAVLLMLATIVQFLSAKEQT